MYFKCAEALGFVYRIVPGSHYIKDLISETVTGLQISKLQINTYYHYQTKKLFGLTGLKDSDSG